MAFNLDKFWDKLVELESSLFELSLDVMEEKHDDEHELELKQGMAGAIKHLRNAFHDVLEVDEQYPLHIDEVCNETQGTEGRSTKSVSQ